VDDLRKIFGSRVRELREKAELSQEKLADRAGIHWTYLGGIERGERNPSLVNIGKIAAALGVEPADLFAGSRNRARR
jgi:transcriptional regulator with XRE-family HTH domain